LQQASAKIGSMDMISLGALRSFREAAPQLKAVILDTIAEEKYPHSFTEFIDAQLDDLPPGQGNMLVLPADSEVGESVSLDWTSGWVKENQVVAVFCPGNLTIAGDLVNRGTHGGPLLLVGGNLNVNNLVCSGSRILILGSINASGVMIGNYNDGVCRIGEDLNAMALIRLDHDVGVSGRINAPVADWDEGTLSLLVPDVFEDDEVNVEAVLSRQHAGLPILRADQ
jgi:hypothetical protein